MSSQTQGQVLSPQNQPPPQYHQTAATSQPQQQIPVFYPQGQPCLQGKMLPQGQLGQSLLQGQPYPQGQPGTDLNVMPQNTVFYPQAQGQPAMPQNAMSYPQSQPQQPQPQQPQVVFLPSGVPSAYYKPPSYKYVPNDFMSLSLLTVIVCGLFSPASLILSIPALLFSRKSKKSHELGSINNARSQGIAAAYLNTAAIVFALVVFCIVTGLVVGLYGPTYGLNKCIQSVEAQYGGSLPTPNPTASAFYYVGYGWRC